MILFAGAFVLLISQANYLSMHCSGYRTNKFEYITYTTFGRRATQCSGFTLYIVIHFGGSGCAISDDETADFCTSSHTYFN